MSQSIQDAVLETLASHRSIRRFSEEPVDESDLLRAIQAGQCAATSSNIQAYCAIRVCDPDRRSRLAELTGGQRKVADAPLFMVVCGDTRRHRLLAARAGHEHASNLETFMLATIDATLFAQNMVVALEAMGYGTCYIGGLRNDLEAVHEVLSTPHGVWPLFGLCVGRPAQEPQRRPRLATDAVFFDERYPEDAAMLDLVDEYDRRMEGWYAANRIDTPNWSSRISEHFEECRRTGNASWYARVGARLD